jgi:hypothetical protein
MPDVARGLPWIVAGTLILASITKASAQEGYSLDDFTVDTAQDLLDVCTLDAGHPHHWEAQAFCYGYFHGGADFHRALSSGPNFQPIACPTDDVTIRGAVAAFVAYARAHPEYLSDRPMDVAFRAVSEKWPCP